MGSVGDSQQRDRLLLKMKYITAVSALNISCSGYFWDDMTKLEKIFSCHGVDIEKEFPKY